MVQDAKLVKSLTDTLAAKLSREELYFVEMVRAGIFLSDAFAKAFPLNKSVQRSNKSAIAVQANRTMAKAHVSAYVDMLNQTREKASGLYSALSRADKRAKIAECVATCEDWDTVLRAIDLDNSMSGDRAPKTTVSLTPSVAIADRVMSAFASRPDAPALKDAAPVIDLAPPSEPQASQVTPSV